MQRRIQAAPGLRLRCAITDGTALTRAQWLVERCAELGAAGVEFLIVRERKLAPVALLHFVRDVLSVAGGMAVLVAGPALLALEAGAAGVHLSSRADEATVEEVRQHFPGAVVTRSCHTLTEVEQARRDGVDVALFGPVFGKTVDGVEVVPGVGVGALEEAVRVAGEMPVFALGGITWANAEQCGAAGVGGIRLFFGADVVA